MKFIKSAVPKALLMLVMMMVICGIIYPLVVTGISKVCFNHKANGSMIEIDGVKYGSELLGQQYTGNDYLWGRIMIPNTDTFKDAKGNKLFYAEPSNLSPASETYAKLIAERVKKLQASNTEVTKVPVDLVTCSGSGLDPHISVNAAYYQVPRIAKARNLSEQEVEEMIDKYTSHKLFGILGENVVNVLEVNLALDGILK